MNAISDTSSGRVQWAVRPMKAAGGRSAKGQSF
jgi:hypothetical protein